LCPGTKNVNTNSSWWLAPFDAVVHTRFQISNNKIRHHIYERHFCSAGIEIKSKKELENTFMAATTFCFGSCSGDSKLFIGSVDGQSLLT